MPTFHRLERTQLIPRPLTETFAFFANAQNLEALTPRFLSFRIETPLPVEMRVGARIDYRLSLSGVPLRWRTLITEWEPNRRFVDEQERGPYRYWRHLHEFTEEGRGTRMRDEVTYALPFGPLGEVAHALLVKRQLATIFDFREQAILGSLGAPMAEPV
jgi:ligand-binding SRPBCC domain-containing protein